MAIDITDEECALIAVLRKIVGNPMLLDAEVSRVRAIIKELKDSGFEIVRLNKHGDH